MVLEIGYNTITCLDVDELLVLSSHMANNKSCLDVDFVNLGNPVLGLVNDCDGLGHGLSGAVSGCYVIRGELGGGIAPLAACP